MSKCTICHDEEVAPNSKLETGPRCRAYLHRTIRKTPAEVLRRRGQLNVYTARMDVMADGDTFADGNKVLVVKHAKDVKMAQRISDALRKKTNSR